MSEIRLAKFSPLIPSRTSDKPSRKPNSNPHNKHRSSSKSKNKLARHASNSKIQANKTHRDHNNNTFIQTCDNAESATPPPQQLGSMASTTPHRPLNTNPLADRFKDSVASRCEGSFRDASNHAQISSLLSHSLVDSNLDLHTEGSVVLHLKLTELLMQCGTITSRRTSSPCKDLNLSGLFESATHFVDQLLLFRKNLPKAQLHTRVARNPRTGSQDFRYQETDSLPQISSTLYEIIQFLNMVASLTEDISRGKEVMKQITEAESMPAWHQDPVKFLKMCGLVLPENAIHDSTSTQSRSTSTDVTDLQSSDHAPTEEPHFDFTTTTTHVKYEDGNKQLNPIECQGPCCMVTKATSIFDGSQTSHGSSSGHILPMITDVYSLVKMEDQTSTTCPMDRSPDTENTHHSICDTVADKVRTTWLEIDEDPHFQNVYGLKSLPPARKIATDHCRRAVSVPPVRDSIGTHNMGSMSEIRAVTNTRNRYPPTQLPVDTTSHKLTHKKLQVNVKKATVNSSTENTHILIPDSQKVDQCVQTSNSSTEPFAKHNSIRSIVASVPDVDTLPSTLNVHQDVGSPPSPALPKLNSSNQPYKGQQYVQSKHKSLTTPSNLKRNAIKQAKSLIKQTVGCHDNTPSQPDHPNLRSSATERDEETSVRDTSVSNYKQKLRNKPRLRKRKRKGRVLKKSRAAILFKRLKIKGVLKNISFKSHISPTSESAKPSVIPLTTPCSTVSPKTKHSVAVQTCGFQNMSTQTEQNCFEHILPSEQIDEDRRSVLHNASSTSQDDETSRRASTDTVATVAYEDVSSIRTAWDMHTETTDGSGDSCIPLSTPNMKPNDRNRLSSSTVTVASGSATSPEVGELMNQDSDITSTSPADIPFDHLVAENVTELMTEDKSSWSSGAYVNLTDQCTIEEKIKRRLERQRNKQLNRKRLISSIKKRNMPSHNSWSSYRCTGELPRNQESSSESTKKRSSSSVSPDEVIVSYHQRGFPYREKCFAVLDSVYNLPMADHFRSEVSSDEEPEYYKYVKFPMCLDTIGSRLRQRSYNRLEDFVKDMRRIFWNCRFYYKRGSETLHSCNTVENFFEEQMLDKFPEHDFTGISGSPKVSGTPGRGKKLQTSSSKKKSPPIVKEGKLPVELRTLFG